MRSFKLTTLVFLFINLSCFAQQPRLVLPVGHMSNVTSAQFSPDGKYIVTASGDKTAKVWDTQTGILLHTLIGHKEGVRFASFSPDGKRIITISNDIDPKVWDLQSGTLLYTLKGNYIAVNSAFFSPDSKRIVTGDMKSARIWDTQTGSLLLTLTDGSMFGSIVQFASYSPDNKRIVSVSEDKKARIWDAQTGLLLFVLEAGHSNFSNYDVGLDKGYAAAFSPDGKWVLTILRDKVARIWNAQNGSLQLTLEGHQHFIYTANFSPDGKALVTASADGTAKIWNTENGSLITTLNRSTLINTLGEKMDKAYYKEIVSASFDPSSKRIVTALTDPYAGIWDMQSGKLLSVLRGHKSGLNSAIFSPDGKRIVTSSLDQTAGVWGTQSGNLLYTLKGDTKLIVSATLSSDDKHIITTSVDDKFARVWDVKNGMIAHDLIGHSGNVIFAVSNQEGDRIITASWDSTARVWDAATGNLLLTLRGHTGQLFTAFFSNDGKKIVTASADSTARIWDANSGALLQTLRGHSFLVMSAIFSPDGMKVVTASYDNTSKIWDAENGKLLTTLRAENDTWFTYACFSPDGKKVLTARWDSAARIWDVATGELLRKITTEQLIVYYVSFSYDGTKIITASKDSTIKIWNVKTGELLENIRLGLNTELAGINFKANKLLTRNNNEAKVINFDPPYPVKYSFYTIGSNDYMFQLPTGYYKTTTTAARQLHYVTKDLKVITFEQLDVKYNRPDKVLEALGNTDTALIKSYRKAWEKRIKKLGIDTTAFRDGYSVPEADFTNRDAIEYEQKNETLKLLIKGSDSTYKLDRFNVWVNETPVFGQRGISIRKKNKNDFDTTITIKLSQGENRIETSITNVNGTESYRMPLTVNYTPAIKQKESIRFIGIGIDQFADNKYNLQYSAKDIRDLSKKLKEKYGNDILIDTLFNENVTISNVKALKQKLQQTTENDKVIIAYSGHGMLSKDYDYYLSTYSINFDKPEQNGLPYDELENLLDSIPARKKLMLIDACHSGEVDKEDLVTLNAASDSLIKGLKPVGYKQEGRLGLKNSFELMQSLFVNVGKSTGATIISAAAGTQFALERNDLKNGVFTYSILEAMTKYPTLKISELKKIVGERVEQITKGLQKPTSRNETIAVDWNVW